MLIKWDWNLFLQVSRFGCRDAYAAQSWQPSQNQLPIALVVIGEWLRYLQLIGRNAGEQRLVQSDRALSREVASR